MYRVKIRGIYSTALTQLLMNEGFRIVQPSAVIRERFNFQNHAEFLKPPDLNIRDRMDRQGVYVTGSLDSLNLLASVLRATFDDVVIRRTPFTSQIILGPYQEEHANLNVPLRKGGEPSLNIEFPGLSKRKLDSIRRTVRPTLKGHHYYKACGGRIAALVEMAEKMLEEGCIEEEVEELLRETIRYMYPHIGSIVEIEHVKVDGYCFHLGIPRVVAFEEKNGYMRLRRTFKRSGIYDGLKVKKEPGDYAITDLKLGDWSLRTRYFSENGEYKGTYININTPIELYPRKIRYVDLEVDVCVWPDGRIAEVDMDKFQEKIQMGYLPEKIESIVKKKINNIINFISINLERDEAFCPCITGF